jgi:predicted ribosome quality control (RQC) complex YloA/Tae2 family protein
MGSREIISMKKEKKIKFRELISKSGTIILAGRNAESNEKLVSQVEKNEEVFHTKAPGSPFVNIKGKPKTGDIKQAVIFCARYSRDWKKNKKDVEVHRFKGKDIYKGKSMKTGTFGVKKIKIIKVKKEDIKEFKKETR